MAAGAHAARTEQREDFVGAKANARGKRHRFVKAMRLYAAYELYVVSGFSRTVTGPSKRRNYVRCETVRLKPDTTYDGPPRGGHYVLHVRFVRRSA